MGLSWYKWFQSDWLTSETRFGMTLAERGLYRDLLDIHYSEGSIPADVRKLRAMVGAQKGFARAWAHVQQFFVPHPSDPTRLINQKAAHLIESRLDSGDASRQNGRLGGRPKGQARKPTRFPPGSEKKPLARASETDTEEEEEVKKDHTACDPKKARAQEPEYDPEPGLRRFEIEAKRLAANRWVLQPAESAWCEVVTSPEKEREVFAGLERWRHSREWRDKIFHRWDRWLNELKFLETPQPAGGPDGPSRAFTRTEQRRQETHDSLREAARRLAARSQARADLDGSGGL